MNDLATWPTLNAALNLTSAVLLTTGYLAIRRRRITVHRRCMLAAVSTSILFLISYLLYHAEAGTTRFAGEGGIRTIYLTILLTHTVLAVVIVPLVVITLVRAFRGRFEHHRRIARITLPTWLYVSVTGVVVYIMLYHLDR
jgi:uncharacterized membrane protein YozB (DUF420 family)